MGGSPGGGGIKGDRGDGGGDGGDRGGGPVIGGATEDGGLGVGSDGGSGGFKGGARGGRGCLGEFSSVVVFVCPGRMASASADAAGLIRSIN